MNIKLELLREYLSDFIRFKLEDFEIVEQIVCVFEKYNVDSGTCHDFS